MTDSINMHDDQPTADSGALAEGGADYPEGALTDSGENPNAGAKPDPGTEEPDPGLTDSGMADGEMTDDVPMIFPPE